MSAGTIIIITPPPKPNTKNMSPAQVAALVHALADQIAAGTYVVTWQESS